MGVLPFGRSEVTFVAATGGGQRADTGKNRETFAIVE
jgi:hypothetical protein